MLRAVFRVRVLPFLASCFDHRAVSWFCRFAALPLFRVLVVAVLTVLKVSILPLWNCGRFEKVVCVLGGTLRLHSSTDRGLHYALNLHRCPTIPDLRPSYMWPWIMHTVAVMCVSSCPGHVCLTRLLVRRPLFHDRVGPKNTRRKYPTNDSTKQQSATFWGLPVTRSFFL